MDIADGAKAVREGNDPDVQRDRLSVDARKWVASKLKPKKYGDRLATEITGKDGGPIQLAAVTLNAQDLPPDAREALRQVLLTAQGAANGETIDVESTEVEEDD